MGWEVVPARREVGVWLRGAWWEATWTTVLVGGWAVGSRGVEMGDRGEEPRVWNVTNCRIRVSEKRGYRRVSVVGTLSYVDKRSPGVPLLGMAFRATSDSQRSVLSTV